MNNVSGSSVVKGAAAYSLLQALLSICGGLAILGLGSLSGNISNLVDNSQLTQQQQQVISAGGALSGLFSLLGVIFGIVGVLMLVNAYGLFQRKSWAWTMTVAIYSLNVVLSVIGWIGGSFNVISLITTVISGVIVYFFLTNADVKEYLGKI